MNRTVRRTPLDFVPSSAVRPMFVALVLGTLAIAGVLRFPYGTEPRMTELQKAGTVQNAKTILATWNISHQSHKARMNMCWDYVFIPFYSTLAAMTCFSISKRRTIAWSSAAVAFGWLSWFAGFCDLGEDVALEFVWHAPEAWSTRLAAVFAYTKYGSLLAVILFVIAASLLRQYRVHGQPDGG